MTDTQAAYIGARFSVLVQVSDPTSSFEATVWKEETTGNVYVSIRGTQGFRDVLEDADLATSGLAHAQLVAMVNWWLRATSIGMAPQIAVDDGIPDEGSAGVPGNFVAANPVQGTGELADISTIKSVNGHSLGGYLATAFSRIFGGGWPVQWVNTFNSAGFSKLAQTNIEAGFDQIAQAIGPTLSLTAFSTPQNNYFAANGINVTTNTWDPIGFAQYGVRIGIFQEDGVKVVSELGISNHFIYKLTDVLALGDALSQWDPSFDISRLSALVSSSTYQMPASYESLLDDFRKLLIGPSVIPTPVGDDTGGNVGPQPEARIQYHKHLYELRTAIASAPAGATIVELGGITFSQIVSLAQEVDGLPYRYALRELNGFAVLGPDAIYDGSGSIPSQNLDGDLNLYVDATSTPAGMTTKYIQERAQLLSWRIAANAADVTYRADVAAVDSWWYVDIPQAYSVYVSGGGASPSSVARIAKFGGDGADGLIGGVDQDSLYGGRGTDLLVGRAGDDYLEGGAGKDVYIYTASTPYSGNAVNDGVDHVLDTDGDGVIRYTHTEEGLLSNVTTTAAIGGLGIRQSASTWVSADGKFRFDQDLGGLRASIVGDAGGNVFVLSFDFAASQKDGYLGIRLVDEIVAPILPVRTFLGDKEDWDSISSTPEVVERVLDEFGNYVRADGQNGRPDIAVADRDDVFLGSNADEVELFDTAGGDDFVQADGADSILSPQGGNDVVLAGSGGDIVQAGGGDDWVEGGSEDDILGGNLGDDVIWAASSAIDGNTVTLAAAITSGNTAPPIAGQGDLLTGDAGSDRLVGASTSDLLLGGDGADIIVGGGGDDNIYGDAALVSASRGWSATRSVTASQSTIIYELVANGYVLDGVLPGANGEADYIYGGAGADWIFAGAGDDYVEGGDTLGPPSTPDDVIFGEAGNDTLIGGSGSDTIHGDSASVDAAGLSGNDYLDGGAGIDFLYGGGGDDILFGGDSGDQLNGNDGNDILVGERGDDLLIGGPGKDTYVFYRGDGVDRIQDVEAGNEADASVLVAADPSMTRSNIRFRPGSLTVDFGNGDEVHFEGFDPDNPTAIRILDTIQFAGGDFMNFEEILAQGFDIDGSPGDDRIYGTAVTDRILAGDGNDYVQAKAGDDLVDGGTGNDAIYGGDGNDTITAGDGADVVYGDDGDDTVDGGGGNDTLSGGKGTDIVAGGAGDDLLDGGAGNDTLTGGAGTDTYVIYGGMGSDSATDGEGGETNVVQLGAGVSVETLAISRVDDDLVVRLRGLKDSITISDYYARPQSWVVRDMAGTETDLETIINQPDPYAGDYIGRLWADTRLGSIARVMGQAYGLGWTPIDGDTFESFYEGAYLSVVKDTTLSTYLRLDPPNDVLSEATSEFTESTVLSFTSFYGNSFHWLQDSFEPGYVESDEPFFQLSLDQLPQTQSSLQALLTLSPDEVLGKLNYHSTAFPGLSTQVSYDTGNGVVDALQITQIVEEKYNEFSDVTKVDPNVAGWSATVNDVFGDKVLANVIRLEDHFYSVRELRGGPSDNVIFANTAGQIFDLVTLIDGGTGNDTIQTSRGLLYGNSGDDQLSGAEDIFIGGDGNDTISGQGGSQFVYTATEAGVDTIADDTTYGYQYLDWYYEAQGIEDWRESAEFGGMYRADFGDGEGGGNYDYYDTYEEAEQDGGSDITFIEPLPSLAPLIGRGDGEALAALEGAGVLKRDIVRFGPGLTLDDLDLTYTVIGSKSDQHPDYPPYVGGTLSVRWGAGAGFDVEVPDANYGVVGTGLFDMVMSADNPYEHPAFWDYQLGLGVEAFEFADGPTYSLEEILQQADLNPVYAYQFQRGSGYQDISTEWRSVDFAADIAPSDLYFISGSPEMQFGVIGDSAYGVIYGWYRNSLDGIPQIEFRFADGTMYDPETVTRMGRTYNGSDFNDTLTADYVFSSALIGNGGDDTLVGQSGNDLLNGGPGRDFERGGEGNDIYVFGATSEVDVVSEYLLDGGSLGTDMVRFEADVSPANLTATRDFDTLILVVNGGAARLEMTGWFTETDGTVENFEFADGTTWHAADVEALLPAQIATAGDDVLLGFSSGELMDGLAGDDVMYGFGGNDALRGGPGTDALLGGAGDDVYEFNVGDGQDLIYDMRGSNAVHFGPDVEPGETVVTRDPGTLYLVVDEGRGRVGVGSWYVRPEARLAGVVFADGTVWDTTALEARVAQAPATEYDDLIWGSEGADVIDGLTGDDTIYGNGGDDVVDGGGGADEILGGFGYDILRGGAGDDYVDASVGGYDLLDGGEGNDHLYYDSRAVAIGGPGDDLVEVYGDNSIVAFNPGDGNDTVYAVAGFTLSIGGGVGPADLGLSIDGQDLVLSVGAQDSVRLTTDFPGSGTWPTMLLQLFGSAHIYYLGGVVNEFYARRAADPRLTDLALGDVLPDYLLVSSETGALGGIIAHQYATRGSLAHVPDSDLLPVLQDSQFGGFFQSTGYAGSNAPPTLEVPLTDAVASEDSPFVYQIPSGTFADPDAGDTLSYAATRADGTALPGWLEFNIETQTFSGTPLQADVGTFEVTVTATDNGGLGAEDTFAVTVENVNDAPVVATPLADQSFEAGSSLAFEIPQASFSDEDPGDTLTFRGAVFGGLALPAWLGFDPSSATFTGSPTMGDIGLYHLQVRATDSAGASAASDFGLVVHAAAGSEVDGTSGDDALYGGSGDETLSGKGGNDYLFGDDGNDLLKGDDGQDVLQGGNGDDVLRSGKGTDVLDGGAGDDLIFGGTGSSLIVGGIGNDTIRTRSGNDVILFNRGDGMDTVIADGKGDNTLSFGGGISYSDLTLSRDGKDLIVNAGDGDGLILRNWYANKQSVLNLQIILDATDEFDATSADPLFNSKVQTFDFLGMVKTFDSAYKQSPGLTSWAVTNALLMFHLGGSDDLAIGGDLAYWYGKKNSFSGISFAAAQQVIGAEGFGSDAQSLHPFSGLQEGYLKLV